MDGDNQSILEKSKNYTNIIFTLSSIFLSVFYVNLALQVSLEQKRSIGNIDDISQKYSDSWQAFIEKQNEDPRLTRLLMAIYMLRKEGSITQEEYDAAFSNVNSEIIDQIVSASKNVISPDATNSTPDQTSDSASAHNRTS